MKHQLDREETASSRPVAKELARYNIDIAALRETRLADEGSITELASGYTFFWKGKAQNKNKIHGVGLAIRTSLLKNLPDLSVGINDRLDMKIRLPLSHKHYATVISAYAPTLTSAGETIDRRPQLHPAFSPSQRQVDSLRRLQCSCWPRPCQVGRSDREAWCREGEQHWPTPAQQVCRVWDPHHKHHIQDGQQIQDNLDASQIQAMAHDRLYHSTPERHPRCSMRGVECWTDHRLVRATLKLRIVPHDQRSFGQLSTSLDSNSLPSTTYSRPAWMRSCPPWNH